MMHEKNISKTRLILIIGVIGAIILKTFVLEGFIVAGDSMSPTIQSGDYVLVNKLAYAFAEPGQGDIIVAKTREEGIRIIKRIAGTPGQRVEVGSEYHTNIDPNEYFVMGDNQEASIDSVEFGAIDRWDIKGRVFGAIRWSSLKYLDF